MSEKLVLVFEISNLQEHYALCMEFIYAIEGKHNIDEYLDKSYKGNFIAKVLKRIIIDLESDAIQAYDMGLVEKSQIKLQKRYKAIDMQGFCDFVKDNITYEFYYFFRINDSSETDVAEFFYYTLMLQAPWIPQQRIAACIFVDSVDSQEERNAYYRFSHYTQLLPPRYKNFYIFADNTIQSLDARDISKFLFPIIEINENSYKELMRTRKLQYGRPGTRRKDASKFAKAVSSIVPQDNTGMVSKEMFIYANNFILMGKGTAIRTEKKIKNITDAIIDLVNNENGISALQYIIFSIMLTDFIDKNKGDDDAKAWISECLNESYEFSEGISQILENIIHHSTSKKGLFSLRLHGYNEQLTYLAQSGAPFIAENDSKKKSRYLQILIGDVNEKHNITTTFLANNSEIAENLDAIRDKLAIRDFFGEYTDGYASEEWSKFRVLHPAKCQGLLKFSNAMRVNKAITSVLSSVLYRDSNDFTRWIRDFRPSSEEEKLASNCRKSYIPGTQFNIIIPVSRERIVSGVAELESAPDINTETVSSEETSSEAIATRYPLKNAFSETFEAYSDFLSYMPYTIDSNLLWDAAVKANNEWETQHMDKSLSQDKKDNLWKEIVHTWDRLFNEVSEKAKNMKKEPVFVVDMTGFCGKSVGNCILWIEPLCKAFIASEWISAQASMYVIFINYNVKFAESFRTTATVNPLALSHKNIQIYFDKGLWNDDNPDILGGSLEITSAALGMDIANDGYDKPNRFPWEYLNIHGDGSIIEKEFYEYVQHELNPNNPSSDSGCRLSREHIKLGSKVHIDTFYEMAPYLMRQEISKKVAFYFVRRLMEDDDFVQLLFKMEEICIYGYAAYSRTVVNAMYEMLTRYIKAYNIKARAKKVSEYRANVSFIIYQTPQAGESVDYEEQVYLSNENIRTKGADKLAIIQIVPISSTLTTFKKLWNKLNEIKGLKRPEAPKFNLTVLWVRNNTKNPELPTKIEKPYWDRCSPKDRTIMTNDPIIGIPIYIISADSKWQNPVECDNCYNKSLGMEIPIIMTDDSSTIPTQQYYQAKSENIDSFKFSPVNEQRVAELAGFIKYGHIKRAMNHFQYYIDMQRYFRMYREEIGKWLGNLEKTHDSKNDIFIVSPQKPNNIEFSQYVNDYYCSGNAKMIYLDSEKHFRSNVEVEYGNYLAHGAGDTATYLYVDTSISTGQTFQRISSLIASIATRAATPFRFDGIFLIVNRLSNNSKKAYIADTQNFHSYVDLNISNMRTYGDSCVGCKLTLEVDRCYKIAATKAMSGYWQGKIYKNSAIFHEDWGKDSENLDNLQKLELQKLKAKGLIRLLCTHKVMCELSIVRGKDRKDYFEVLKDIFNEAFRISLSTSSRISKNSESVFDHLDIVTCQKKAKQTVLISYVKVLSRPFFSYDFQLKTCVADILMLFTMLILENYDLETTMRSMGVTKNKPVFSEDNDSWRNQAADLLKELLSSPKLEKDFLLILIKALSDLNMNFIYRKEVITKINRFLIANKLPFGVFYKHYIRYIISTVDCVGEECKGLRLEYLLQKHCDYNTSISNISFFDSFGLNEANRIIKLRFQTMLNLLFMENNHILFNGFEIIDRDLCNYPQIDNLLKESHMWDFCRFALFERSGEIYVNGQMAAEKLIEKHKDWIENNIKLYSLLCNDIISPDKNNDEKRYITLQDWLIHVANTHFEACKLSLIARHRSDDIKSKYISYDKHFCLVAPDDEEKENAIIKLLNEQLDAKIENILDIISFHIGVGYIIIKLENNHSSINNAIKKIVQLSEKQHSIPSMEPLYILIQDVSIEPNGHKSLALIRNILLYRYQLILWLEKDFNNDTMASIARISRSAKLLTMQKAGDHQDIQDLDYLQSHLSSQPWPKGLKSIQSFKSVSDSIYYNEQYSRKKNFDIRTKWLLLHSYVNQKIGRLFRAMVDYETLHTTLKFKDLYRVKGLEDSNARGKEMLETLSDAFLGTINERILKTEIPETSEKIKIDLTGLSREYWLDLLFEVIVFRVKKKKITSKKKFKNAFDDYKFVSLDYGTDIYGYCSEQFSCLFLDFCYSAIKYSVNWEVAPYNQYYGGAAEKFLFFQASDKKCVVNIEREVGGNFGPVSYDWLILESSMHEDSEKQGMSIPSLRWYFDSLWRECAQMHGFKNPPEVIVDKQADRFILKLPILKGEGRCDK